MILVNTPTYRYSGGRHDGLTPKICFDSCAIQGITQGTDKNLTIGLTRGDICLCGVDFETHCKLFIIKRYLIWQYTYSYIVF